MKRRGFLGFMGGAVAAGPGMAKQAAAQTLADLSIPHIQNPVPEMMLPDGPDDTTWAVLRYGNFKKFLKSAERLRQKRLGMSVHALDPDLAAMRSLSLTTKVRMQRDRNFERWLESEAGWLQRAINGEEDY